MVEGAVVVIRCLWHRYWDVCRINRQRFVHALLPPAHRGGQLSLGHAGSSRCHSYSLQPSNPRHDHAKRKLWRHQNSVPNSHDISKSVNACVAAAAWSQRGAPNSSLQCCARLSVLCYLGGDAAQIGIVNLLVSEAEVNTPLPPIQVHGSRRSWMDPVVTLGLRSAIPAPTHTCAQTMCATLAHWTKTRHTLTVQLWQ